MYRESKELPVVEREHPCLVGWRKRRDEAERRGYFTTMEMHHALNWDMCAVGEARAQGFPIKPGKASSVGVSPADLILENLGAHFFRAVKNNNFKFVLEILEAIEQRVSEL